MLSGLSGLSGLSAVCGGAAYTPTAPAGAVFAAVAHPDCCRSDAACLVPCGAGDAIRWWRELVSGVWYEQATSGARLILRDAGGGKWYAEGAAGRTHVFTGFSAGAGSGVLHAVAAYSTNLIVGNDAQIPWDSKPASLGTLRTASNLQVQAVDGTGNPVAGLGVWTVGVPTVSQARHTAATGVLQRWKDAVSLGTTGSTPGASLVVQSPQVGASAGIGYCDGGIYAVAYYDTAADPDDADTWARGYLL